MKLKDFADERGVDRDTIAQYVRRHQKTFEKHIKMDGNSLRIDETAEAELSKKYPILPVIQSAENLQTLKELAEANRQLAKVQQMVIDLQQEKYALTARCLTAESNKQQIEYKADLMEKKAEKEKQKSEDLQKEITELKTRGFWARIRNK